MRTGAALAVLLALGGCIPSSGGKRPPPERMAAQGPARESLQCRSDLARDGVRFRALEDRVFGKGCSALGAVQLLDVGTPVANLGAMTCPLARQFSRWAREAVQPAAAAWLGSRVVRIESFGTYGCRPVNSRPGAKLSEHGRANAVDIGAFLLADGRRITVLAGWRSEDEDVRRFLRAVHAAACRRFGVVLGPDADSFHRDHLHFDMGHGPYCR
ncbi:MAG TPA: extensin family protein [Allosphingosinicella sp.]|jgi:hypothetical protein